MEFDNIFTAIQGSLLSAQKILNIKFADIVKNEIKYGTNDSSAKALLYITKALKELNLSEEYSRKVHLLFLLNTTFYSCTLVEDDNNFSHIIGCIPQISEYLYIKLVIQMDWYPFLSETILFGPEVLTIDILRFLERKLYLLDSDKAVHILHSLYENLFKKIIICDCKCRRQRIVNYLLKLLKFDFTDIVNQMDCNKIKKLQYWGYVNKMYLELTEFCVRFMSAPTVNKHELYNFNFEYDYTKWPNSASETDWGRHCFGVIVAKTAESFKNVSLDMYISWCEIEIPGSTSKTLQTTVREAAYKCCEALKSVAYFYDYISELRSLQTNLENIALRPITEDEEVAAADPTTIVINILNPNRTQVKWLRGLIDRGVFESAPYMKVVTDNARLIDLETCQLLLTKAVLYISSNSVLQSDLTLIRDTVFCCIRALSSADQMKLLETFLLEYGPTTVFSSDNFESTVIAFLNKIVLNNDRSQEECQDVVCLTFENPERFLSLCLHECLTSKKKSELIVEIFQYIRPIFCTQYRGICLGFSQVVAFISSVSKENVDKHTDVCLYTITSLCQKSLLDGKKLLNDHIIPGFESSLSDKDLLLSTFYLEIIEALTKVEDYSSLSLITLIAKTMNRIRPKVTTFSMKAVNFTSSSAKLLISLIDRFLKYKNDEEDSEVKWLRSVATCLSPLTCRYMTLLWTKWGKAPPLNRDDPAVYCTLFGLGKGLTLSSLVQNERFTIVSTIVKVLPQLTVTEWEEIGCSEVSGDKKQVTETTVAVFFVLADCVLILFQLPFMIQNPTSLGHTLTNFIRYCQVHILPLLKKLDVDQRISIQDKIDQIANQLPETLIKSKMPFLVHLQKSISDSDTSGKIITELLNNSIDN